MLIAAKNVHSYVVTIMYMPMIVSMAYFKLPSNIKTHRNKESSKVQQLRSGKDGEWKKIGFPPFATSFVQPNALIFYRIFRKKCFIFASVIGEKKRASTPRKNYMSYDLIYRPHMWIIKTSEAHENVYNLFLALLAVLFTQCFGLNFLLYSLRWKNRIAFLVQALHTSFGWNFPRSGEKKCHAQINNSFI